MHRLALAGTVRQGDVVTLAAVDRVVLAAHMTEGGEVEIEDNDGGVWWLHPDATVYRYRPGQTERKAP